MLYLRYAAFAFVLAFAAGTPVFGKDKSQWADADPARREWFRRQTMTPDACNRVQVGNCSCCDHGDVFKTRFRLAENGSKYGVETYEYWKDDKWKLIPPDIVKHDKTPDGRPVLFINHRNGQELCFIIDEEGI